MTNAFVIRRRGQAGFTLIELAAVVLITAVLAAVGMTVFRKFLFSSKGGEAQSVIQAIRSAEESYLGENHVYLNVSSTGGSDARNGRNWYPQVTPSRTRSAWGGWASHPDIANWTALAPPINRTVQFSYLANAGLAGQAVTVPVLTTKPTFPVPTQSWYMIQAEGDTDGDGVFANYASTSMTGAIYSEREGE